MIWKDYSKLKGTHAFCGASKKSWRNWTVDQLIAYKQSSYAQAIGTLLHEYAAANIENHFRMYKTDKRGVLRYLTVEKGLPSNVVDIDRLFPNLMNYINDCIGFRMDAEKVLYYSDDFYGTTDAIYWSDKTHELKISDLKTGITPVEFDQLENYAAFFCLDYKVKPNQIKKLEFRLYQNGEVLYAEPDPVEVLSPVIDQIVAFNKALMEFEGKM